MAPGWAHKTSTWIVAFPKSSPIILYISMMTMSNRIKSTYSPFPAPVAHAWIYITVAAQLINPGLICVSRIFWVFLKKGGGAFGKHYRDGHHSRLWGRDRWSSSSLPVLWFKLWLHYLLHSDIWPLSSNSIIILVVRFKSLQCTGVHIDAFNRSYVLGGVYNPCWYLFTRDICVMVVKCIIADFFHVRGVPNTINNVWCSTHLSPRFLRPALVIKSLERAFRFADRAFLINIL